jgi:hypothetical protein
MKTRINEVSLKRFSREWRCEISFEVNTRQRFTMKFISTAVSKNPLLARFKARRQMWAQVRLLRSLHGEHSLA